MQCQIWNFVRLFEEKVKLIIFSNLFYIWKVAPECSKTRCVFRTCHIFDTIGRWWAQSPVKFNNLTLVLHALKAHNTIIKSLNFLIILLNRSAVTKSRSATENWFGVKNKFWLDICWLDNYHAPQKEVSPINFNVMRDKHIFPAGYHQ